jgi:hypothetical protein
VGEVSIGDKIEIHLLPDGEADPPTSKRQSSDIPAFLSPIPIRRDNSFRQPISVTNSFRGYIRGHDKLNRTMKH